MIPGDEEALQEAMKLETEMKWIVKPSSRGEGKGIFVADTYADVVQGMRAVNQRTWVIQKLLKPHLIDGKKYDLRTYVFVSQYQPLQAHFYHEGIVRFAANTYNNDGKAKDGRSRWLTNTYAPLERCTTVTSYPCQGPNKEPKHGSAH